MADERIIVDHPLVHAPGIYFGMPDEEYHAALGLSASGVKLLRMAPMAWWEASPLNPKLAKVETEAMKIGKAYHARIVEGHSVFWDRYAELLDPEAHPDALRTVADLNAALSRHLLKPPSRAVKADLIQLLLRVEPDARIWDEMIRRHAEIHEGKIMLDAGLIDQIERAARMIETHPQLGKSFAEGAAEVSVFWVDETGVPCKCRMDYLKPLAIIDLKSFVLRDTLPDKAIVRAVTFYKYHIQADFYLRAAAELPRLVAAGQVYGDYDEQFLQDVINNPKTFLFVWQAKDVGLTIGKVLPPGIVLDMGHIAVEDAILRWRDAWAKWGGTAEWNEIRDITRFSDDEFPPWINE